jgi:flagellar basal body rod protein FlgC
VYRAEEIANYIKFQEEEMEAFVKERDKLIEVQEEKKAAMKRRQWEEEVELEKAFNAELTQLMDQYSPHHPDGTVAGL